MHTYTLSIIRAAWAESMCPTHVPQLSTEWADTKYLYYVFLGEVIVAKYMPE